MSIKVVYLDDEPELCDIFAEEFGRPNITITTYTDAKKAIAASIESAPDLLFIDYRLPGGTGDDVARAMPPDVPKYLVTGEVSVETLYQFAGVLRKPFNREAIRQILNSMVALRAKV